MHFNNRNNSASSAFTSTSSSLRTPKSSSTTSHDVRLGVWCFLLVAMVLMAQQQPCEGRYLETRAKGDSLDKLRELMLQILASGNDDQQPANQATDKILAAQRANWKYPTNHGVFDNGRYF